MLLFVLQTVGQLEPHLDSAAKSQLDKGTSLKNSPTIQKTELIMRLGMRLKRKRRNTQGMDKPPFFSKPHFPHKLYLIDKREI